VDKNNVAFFYEIMIGVALRLNIGALFGYCDTREIKKLIIFDVFAFWDGKIGASLYRFSLNTYFSTIWIILWIIKII
jgi:hypothetical protein